MSPLTYALIGFAHLVGVVLASSVFLRARSLRRFAAAESDGVREEAVQAVLRADNVWGLSALVLIGTGLVRLFVIGKGTAYYLANGVFHAKLGLLALMLALELWPMITLLRYRLAERRGEAALAPGAARRMAQLSFVETAAVALMMLCATMMARGIGQLS